MTGVGVVKKAATSVTDGLASDTASYHLSREMNALARFGVNIRERADALSAALEEPLEEMERYKRARERCEWTTVDARDLFSGCYNFFPSMRSFRYSKAKGWEPINPEDPRWLMQTRHCLNFRKRQRAQRCIVRAYDKDQAIDDPYDLVMGGDLHEWHIDRIGPFHGLSLIHI